jgi:hypothetical protein
MDGLLLPALIAFLALAIVALAAGAESRDGFAITHERPSAHH